MALHSTLLDELATRDGLFSLSRDFYNSEAVYQTDLDLIWYQSWVFAGHTCELTHADSTISFQLADYAIIIRKVNNTYLAEHDNSAANAPTKRTIHCNEIDGFLFVSLAETPDDFETFKATVSPYIAPHRMANLKIAHETSIVEYGNWKLVFENNRECYHCLSNHPELIITYPEDPSITGTDANSELPEMVKTHWEQCEKAGYPSKFQLAEDGSYRVARMPLLNDFTSYTMDGTAAVKKPLADYGKTNLGALVLFHYPSTWNHFLGDHVVTFRVLPISATATLVTTKWLVHQDAVEGVDYDIETLTHVWNQTNAQDKKLVEENQRGINSPAYESGPYSAVYESGVIQFVAWYSQLLQQRIGSKAA